MAVDTPLEYMSISDLATRLREQQLSPTALLEHTLARIERLDSELQAYLAVSADLARTQAAKAEEEIGAGHYRGPLHGVPVAVKDLIYTRGVPTTCGSKILDDWLPDYDATVISRLQQHGAVLLGKLTMTEFAGIGYHPSVTAPSNPWHANHWTGQSSSGCGVAEAAGLCYGSLGTDTGGSLRYPASACGVVGLRPTYGRVSRHGVFPLAESLDAVGPITRSAEDAAILLGAIAGYDDADPTTVRAEVPDYNASISRRKRLRIGVDDRFCDQQVQTEVHVALTAALEALETLDIELVQVSLSGIDEAVGAWRTIFVAECLAAHEQFYPEKEALYSDALREFLAQGAQVTGVDYAKAQSTRFRARQMLDQLLEVVDFIVCPTMGVTPPTLEEFPASGIIPAERADALLRFTAPFALTGHPAISIPAGFSEAGLPIGLQFVGRHFDESTLLSAAVRYQSATDWHLRRPL